MEVGYEHVLLLNEGGQVFSFGKGLKGQLGHSDAIIRQNKVQEITFPKYEKKKELKK